MDKHFIREYPKQTKNLINNLYFDPTSNTQMHVQDTSITNIAVTYPFVEFSALKTPGTMVWSLLVSTLNETKSFPLNVTQYDEKDTSIKNMSDSWKLPTGFFSNYPDSVNIDLTGYLTGPGMQFETIFLNGSVNVNGMTEVRINGNLANYDLEK